MIYELETSVEPVFYPVTLEEMRLHLRVTDGTELEVDFGGVATTLNDGAETGIPSASHGLSTSGGDFVIVSGTAKHDGAYLATDNTTDDIIAIPNAYVAETFIGTERVFNGGNEDIKIFNLMKAAVDVCEKWEAKAYAQRTLVQKWNAFPVAIRPARSPLVSVTSIGYIDTAGDDQTLSSALYRVSDAVEPAIIVPEFGQVWPFTQMTTAAVTLTYVAGYATRAEIPERAKQAVMMLVGHWFENRETVVVGTTASEVPLAVQALLSIDSRNIV